MRRAEEQRRLSVARRRERILERVAAHRRNRVIHDREQHRTRVPCRGAQPIAGLGRRGSARTPFHSHHLAVEVGRYLPVGVGRCVLAAGGRHVPVVVGCTVGPSREVRPFEQRRLHVRRHDPVVVARTRTRAPQPPLVAVPKRERRRPVERRAYVGIERPPTKNRNPRGDRPRRERVGLEILRFAEGPRRDLRPEQRADATTDRVDLKGAGLVRLGEGGSVYECQHGKGGRRQIARGNEHVALRGIVDRVAPEPAVGPLLTKQKRHGVGNPREHRALRWRPRTARRSRQGRPRNRIRPCPGARPGRRQPSNEHHALAMDALDRAQRSERVVVEPLPVEDARLLDLGAHA